MDNRKRNTSLIIYIAGVIILTFTDQLTKVMAADYLKGKSPFVIIDNVFELYYLENSGAAWGVMSGARYFFLILTVVIVAIVIYVSIKMPHTNRMVPLRGTLILLSAGAVGNFIDRLCFGYVRDFIYFKLINFPVFNVADIYVTVSVIIFAILILFVYKEDEFEFIKKNSKVDSL